MSSGARNQIRIIAGEWRGRKLSFADVEGLRPTPDRVRETLFNWLSPLIRGARCLDPFAGSGALGLEALSRGAAEVVMLDKHPRVITQLNSNLSLLNCQQAVLRQADALDFLQGTPDKAFDVVFLDPPFRENMLAPCCELLSAQAWLADGARVYLETERGHALPVLPDNWQLQRSKKAGQVAYHLAVVSG